MHGYPKAAAWTTAMIVAGFLMSGPAAAQNAQPRQTPATYYYPVPGYYATTAGTVWIPNPGYYYNVPTVYAQAAPASRGSSPPATFYSRGYSSPPSSNGAGVTPGTGSPFRWSSPSLVPRYSDVEPPRRFAPSRYRDRRSAAGIDAEGADGRTNPDEWGSP